MKPRRDRRRAGALLTLAAVLAGGLWLDQRGPAPASSSTPASMQATAPPMQTPQQAELTRRFNEAVFMLHARQFEHAVTALHRVLVLSPRLPEAHVNMGFALLGLQRHQEARAFFDGAAALQPAQANAYYGLALAWEAAGDKAMATGAMRTYLHLARQEAPQHLAKARAALWEWERSARPAR